MRRRSVAAFLVVAMTITGCSGFGIKSAADSGSDASSGESGPISTDPALNKVALRNSDLRPGAVGFHLFTNGDKVGNQVTLDFCEVDYPSEQLRSARFQQWAGDGDDNFVVSNESVTYKSAAGAAQALQEARGVWLFCPKDQFRPSLYKDVPDQKSDFAVVPDDQLGPVAADHFVIAGQISIPTGESEHYVFAFQRRGRVMAAVYGAELVMVQPFLAIIATRLADLTAFEAGE